MENLRAIGVQRLAHDIYDVHVGPVRRVVPDLVDQDRALTRLADRPNVHVVRETRPVRVGRTEPKLGGPHRAEAVRLAAPDDGTRLTCASGQTVPGHRPLFALLFHLDARRFAVGTDLAEQLVGGNRPSAAFVAHLAEPGELLRQGVGEDFRFRLRSSQARRRHGCDCRGLNGLR